MAQGCDTPATLVPFPQQQRYLAYFATLIETARKARGLTRVQLGAMVGVSEKTIAALAWQQHFPNMRTFLHLCVALELDFEVLMLPFDTPQPPDPDDPVVQVTAFLRTQPPRVAETYAQLIPVNYPGRKCRARRRKAVTN